MRLKAGIRQRGSQDCGGAEVGRVSRSVDGAGDRGSALVLELDHAGLAHGMNGSYRPADAFGDLLIEPLPLASLVCARGVPGLDLDRRSPRADHDDGVAELPAGGAPTL
jgi:hypothetical protein